MVPCFIVMAVPFFRVWILPPHCSPEKTYISSGLQWRYCKQLYKSAVFNYYNVDMLYPICQATHSGYAGCPRSTFLILTMFRLVSLYNSARTYFIKNS